MKNHFPLLFLVFVIAAFSAAAHASGDCADELGCVEIGPEENIVFGGILRLSGPAPLDRRYVARQCFSIWRCWSVAGVCLSVKIELVLEDSACYRG